MNNQEFDIALGSALRAERKRKGMTQSQIAVKLGVTKVAVHQWETGKRSMYAQSLREYCDALGVTVQSVFDRM